MADVKVKGGNMSRKKNKTNKTEKIQTNYKTDSDEQNIKDKINEITKGILNEAILLTQRKKYHIRDLVEKTETYIDLTANTFNDNKLVE